MNGFRRNNQDQPKANDDQTKNKKRTSKRNKSETRKNQESEKIKEQIMQKRIRELENFADFLISTSAFLVKNTKVQAVMSRHQLIAKIARS